MEEDKKQEAISVAASVKEADQRLYRTILMAPIIARTVWVVLIALAAVIYGYFVIKRDIKDALEIEQRHYSIVQQLFETVHPGQKAPPP